MKVRPSFDTVSLHSLPLHTKFPTCISTHITQTLHSDRRLSPHDWTTSLTHTVLKTCRTDPAPLTDFQATRDAPPRHRYVTEKWAQLHVHEGKGNAFVREE